MRHADRIDWPTECFGCGAKWSSLTTTGTVNEEEHDHNVHVVHDDDDDDAHHNNGDTDQSW